jgi:multidrug resistance efflux pump
MTRKPLNLSWLIATLILIGLTFTFKPSAKSFLGILNTKTVSPGALEDSIVSNLYVSVGQSVSEGETIAKLENKTLELAINSVKYEIRVTKQAISRSNKTGEFSKDLKIKVEKLEKELEIRESQLSSLMIKSKIDGVVTKLFVNEGDIIAKNQKLGEISSRVSDVVLGYIHEDGIGSVQVGSPVKVESLSGIKIVEDGKVVSVSSTIEQIPDRITNTGSIGIKSFGRLVKIKLATNSEIIPGSKVTIIIDESANQEDIAQK